jgi:hypothetical protein
VAPADGATGVSIPATLEVTVSDPQGDSLDVTFYGKGGTSGDDDFAIVALPDTQYYSQSYPDIFTAQTQWIVDNASSRNIVFVTHEGDIVQNYNVEGEWINANYSMSLLDGVVAYGLLPGNHDMDTSTRRAPLYNSTFPSTRYEAEPWYGGHYDSDADWDNNNNYQLFSAGGMDFIVLHLEYNPRSEVIGWADGVLSGNAGRMAIITTHAYLNTDGNRLSEGTGIWNVLVQGNDNVYFVLCGHMHGEAKRTDVVNGREVHQILADYQSGPNGGNGYLRIMRFVPAEDKVYVETYSPYLDQYQTDSDSQFSLDVPMEWYAEIGTNTDVSSGSNTSVDWSDLQPGTAYEWFVEVSDTSGNTRVGPTWQFTTGGNQPPIANAGSDQTVSDSDSDGIETVILDGSGSYDPDGTITGYEWKEGTTVLGIDAIITCDFSVGAHTVTLTVTDDEGASDSDDVIITVNANAAPVADAGDDQTINDSDGDGMETVTLDGAGSADSDGTIVSYEWDTDGDGSVDKVGVTVDAVFSVGTHTVTLTVTDNGGATATDDVVVTVSQPDYDAYVSQDPTVTYGLVGGGIEGTTSAGDGLVQTITEVPNGTAGMASLQAEYVLSTTANPADVTQLTLYLDATWTSLDADAPLAVAIWNGSGWEDITEDISDGSFAPGIPQDYVDDGGNIYVRFTDTAAIKKEKKDTLTIDLLYAQVLAGPVNNPPSVTISQPANGSTFDSGALISFGGTATDVEDGDLTASLVWQSSINGQIGTGGSVSVTLSDGEHLITASATDSGGKTGSASISITVGDPPPAAPTGLVATAGNSLVRLDWDDNAESDLAGYNVYRSQTEGGPYSQVNGTLVTASDYEDAGMTNGTTYYYVVTAVDQASNESPVSSEVSATPSEQPAVYVESIGMSLVQAGKNWKGVAQVAINPALSGATVVGDWYLNEELIQTGAADVTDGSGQTSFTSAPKKANTGATFTFMVTDVVVSGYVYDSGQGVTQGSITVQ